MIPLGSCTMKLNATAEMMPVTWPEWGQLHPFAPAEQAAGYRELFTSLEKMLSEITGFAATSLQPNAGSQGEYAGLLVIRAYHESRGQAHRNVCLIPSSAHGTNPASAVMAGYRVVVVACDDGGNIDLADLEAKAAQHKDALAALMVTYPSTHGVFEDGIKRICAIVHEHGGQVYMDGANMNAQVGLCRPGDIGADVCHLNLHKTFCIPHGGGGPGMGPIARGGAPGAVPARGTRWSRRGGRPRDRRRLGGAVGQRRASCSISWAYIPMMGADGLTQRDRGRDPQRELHRASGSSRTTRSSTRARSGRVAHECILDVRQFKKLRRHRGRRRRQAADGLRLPRADDVVPDPGHADDRADRERVEGRARSLLRRDDRDPRGDRARSRRARCRATTTRSRTRPTPSRRLLAAEWTHPYTRERAAFPRPDVRAASSGLPSAA